jgi:hypothetical protein
MAPPKRTMEKEAKRLAQFLSDHYFDESEIKGWSAESPFGYAAREIFRDTGKRYVARLVNI